jgi:hypothetical protein
MAKFLIEVPHDPEARECALAVQVFLTTGSNFLKNADWGCQDGVHKGWIIVELDNKEEVRNILPPNYRSQAKIIKLNKFSIEEIDEILLHHKK